jgi:hypothetical protein
MSAMRQRVPGAFASRLAQERDTLSCRATAAILMPASRFAALDSMTRRGAVAIPRLRNYGTPHIHDSAASITATAFNRHGARDQPRQPRPTPGRRERRRLLVSTPHLLLADVDDDTERDRFKRHGGRHKTRGFL